MHNAECGSRPKVLCAKYKSGRVCGGDSGGPLVADRDNNGVWVQYGIMSFITGPIGVSKLYSDEQKRLYLVARILFLFLLNCSAWPCLGPA